MRVDGRTSLVDSCADGRHWPGAIVDAFHPRDGRVGRCEAVYRSVQGVLRGLCAD